MIMNKGSKIMPDNLQRKNDYDLHLTLIAQRESALHLIKTTKNRFIKQDRYRQVCRLNKQIETLRRKMKL